MLAPGTVGATDRVRGLAWVGALGWALFAVINAPKGAPITVAVDVAVAGLLVGAALVADRPRLSARLQLCGIVGGLVLASWLSGGAAANAPWYLAVVPVLAVLLDRHGALAWTLACGAGVLLGQVTPAWVPTEFVPTEADRVFGQVALVFLAGAVAFVVRAVFERQLAELGRRERELLERATSLELAHAAALAASRAREQFLGRVSHEIRTPLNGVLGLTRVLGETALDAEQRDLVRTLERSGRTLLALVNDTLDYESLAVGGVTLDLAPTDVVSVVEDVLDLNAAVAAERGLELCRRVAADAPRRVEGDVERMRQLLANLVANAVKYTAQGFVEVRIGRGPRRELVLEVADSGPGFPADVVERLFEPFNRGGDAAADLSPGTGLGVTVTRALAEAMGGRIEVASGGPGAVVRAVLPLRELPDEVELPSGLEGRRARIDGLPHRSAASLAHELVGFGLRLEDPADVEVVSIETPALPRLLEGKGPLVVVAPIGDPRARRLPARDGLTTVRLPPRRAELLAALRAVSGLGTPAGASRMVPARLEPRRVLVAEDNPVNQQVVALMLERLGQRAVMVSNGAEAVRAASEGRWDLILMDLRMPVLDGIEATRRIRALRGPRPRIYVTSASVLPEHRATCRAVGMDGFLDKPLQLEQLAAALAGAPAVDAVADPDDEARGRDALERIRALVTSTAELRELLDQYRANAARLLAGVADAAERDDWTEVSRLAHQLKGASATFGAPELARIAGRIEGGPAASVVRPDASELERALARATARHAAVLHALEGASPVEPETRRSE